MRRGDTTGDSTVNLADAVFPLRGLFLGATQPECGDAAGVDDNGRVNLADVVHLLLSLFLGKGGQPAPFPDCGLDTTPDELPCAQPAACSRRGKPQ